VYFNSQVFLYLFLPAVLAGYYAVPFLLRLRGGALRTFLNAFLFAASVLFYAWGEREFVAVLLGSLAVNYELANAVERDHRRGRSGKRPLLAAVLFDLGLLVGFKYTPFLAVNLSAVSEALGGGPVPVPDVHLPIGVSFFTFQAMSYVLDVSRREVPAQRNFLLFGLYVFLFPHLIAGPIVRYRDIAEQLTGRRPSLDQFAAGVRRLSAGLAKKVLLADTFAKVVDDVFHLPAHELTTSAAWLGAGCYALQIYFDFSGYSDMAIGLGKLFGFEFLENFDHPYAAKSVTEFWRRWHISLSSWFRDYVYVPLGGNRGGAWKTYRNLLVVFVLCGIWHGANWTFLLWGVYHGAFLILERLGVDALLERTPRPLRHVYTLLAVTAGWVLFRAQTLPQAGAVLAAMFGCADGGYVADDFVTNQLLVALLVGIPASGGVYPRRPEWAAPIMVGLLMLAAEVWLAGSTYSAFIYFRF
jgi:alginate O-acetyltransferase complex protein AlgI